MIPSLQQAKELYDFAVSKTNIINVRMNLPAGISACHYQNVAFVAASIAQVSGLDSSKAYILGLLHDYGEYIEDTVDGTFHGTAGYDEMLKLGFDEVARTCLSHSFFDSDFTPDDFPAYDRQQIIRAAELIKLKPFDDYDRLIHLADLMSPGDSIDTIENRIFKIAVKYNLSKTLTQNKLNRALELKEYFDKMCNTNVYKILGL